MLGADDMPADNAELVRVVVDFPRLDPDAAESCPVGVAELLSYLADEVPGGERLTASDLRFLRTAQVRGRRYWIWGFREPDGGGPAFATRSPSFRKASRRWVMKPTTTASRLNSSCSPTTTACSEHRACLDGERRNVTGTAWQGQPAMDHGPSPVGRVRIVPDATFEVTVSAGALRPSAGGGVTMSHRWTPEGVVVESEFTGAHLYLLAAAGCVLNDVYREAERLSVPITGVRVRATGGFDPSSWSSTGVEYDVEVASEADADEIERLVQTVDEVAEIPKALRAGATVSRRRAR